MLQKINPIMKPPSAILNNIERRRKKIDALPHRQRHVIALSILAAVLPQEFIDDSLDNFALSFRQSLHKLGQELRISA
jgi:hypothetical protein